MPVVCLVAGFGFAASARDSRGTDLRAAGHRQPAPTWSVPPRRRCTPATRRSPRLQAQVDRGHQRRPARRLGGRRRRRRSVGAAARAGRPDRRRTGPGSRSSSTTRPRHRDADVDPNQLVVHQSDLQAVVNALWAGGAEAMTIAGQRVIATSAVRCVGNTLLLNGEVYSPPFRVAGDRARH